MRAKSEYPGNHGRQHRSTGSDPIWPGEPWIFNFDNEGGWGYVQTNANFDLDLLPDPVAEGGLWGLVFEDDSGRGILIGSVTYLKLKSRTRELEIESQGATWDFVAGGSGVVAVESNDVNWQTSSGDPFNIDSGGSVSLSADTDISLIATGKVIVDPDDIVQVKLASGKKLEVLDSANNPIFRVNEDGSIQIKTGATITANL